MIHVETSDTDRDGQDKSGQDSQSVIASYRHENTRQDVNNDTSLRSYS